MVACLLLLYVLDWLLAALSGTRLRLHSVPHLPPLKLPALPAGQLAVWEGVVPAKLPGPTADLDVLHGVKQKGVPGTTAGGMGGGMADGGSVLEGGAGGTGTADGGSDEYDREDSFLADSGAKGPDAAAGGGRRRGRGSRYGGGGGGAGLSSFDLPQPQEPVQSGATEMGEQAVAGAVQGGTGRRRGSGRGWVVGKGGGALGGELAACYAAV